MSESDEVTQLWNENARPLEWRPKGRSSTHGTTAPSEVARASANTLLDMPPEILNLIIDALMDPRNDIAYLAITELLKSIALTCSALYFCVRPRLLENVRGTLCQCCASRKSQEGPILSELALAKILGSPEHIRYVRHLEVMACNRGHDVKAPKEREWLSASIPLAQNLRSFKYVTALVMGPSASD